MLKAVFNIYNARHQINMDFFIPSFKSITHLHLYALPVDVIIKLLYHMSAMVMIHVLLFE